MNRTFLFFILSVVSWQTAMAQIVLPANRRVDWSKADYNGTSPSYPQVSITGFSADSTGNNFSDSAIISPIVLKSFTAFATSCNATLHWVANDVAGDTYTIESSSEGVHFTTLKMVDADGATNGSIYTYTLAQPDVMKWYRLKMTGKNGDITYSRMAPINIRCNKQVAFSVYPNPVSDNLNVSYEAAAVSAQTFIWVNDAAGNTVLKKDVVVQTGKNNWLLDMQALPPGLYYVQLRNEEGIKASQKVMKK